MPVGSSPEASLSSLEQLQQPPWKEDPGQPSQTYFTVHSRCRAKKIRRSTGGLDWMQSSFTAQTDGTYVGRIRTGQETTEVTFALGSLFELRGLLVSLSLYMLLT